MPVTVYTMHPPLHYSYSVTCMLCRLCRARVNKERFLVSTAWGVVFVTITVPGFLFSHTHDTTFIILPTIYAYCAHYKESTGNVTIQWDDHTYPIPSLHICYYYLGYMCTTLTPIARRSRTLSSARGDPWAALGGACRNKLASFLCAPCSCGSSRIPRGRTSSRRSWQRNARSLRTS
jgi:hypothetical protein